jgi:tRNA pseudouridine13 synthase
MTFDPLAAPPLLTPDLPGIGGRIKVQPEDFEVEEIPAYEPCGTGDFLYLWIEKRDMGAEYFVRQVARRLDVPVGEVGTAGLKDRRAVARQMASVPVRAESRLKELDGDGVRLLRVSRHTNKLRPGHLHGNRFRILVRGVNTAAQTQLQAVVTQLRSCGLPNFFGPQRFGRDGETVLLGMAMLRKEALDPTFSRTNPRSPFLRKLALSAAQAALFNHTLAQRMTAGLLRRILPGDVMAKRPFGGLFVAEDAEQEQARFDARETVTAGPMFGRKMFAAVGEPAAREAAVLQEAGLTPESFHGFGKLVQGTRRHNLVYLDDLAAAPDADGIRLSFSLPAGSYATVLLREVMKAEPLEADESA